MQRCFLVFAFLIASVSAFGQALSNGGFEMWEPNPNGANEIPSGWYGNFSTTQTIAKDTNAFAGEYALRVMSRTQGFEGWLPGYVSTKVAATSNVGVLTCMIAIDTMEHYDMDTSFAIIRIDTTEEFLWSNDSVGSFGFYATHDSTPGYVSVSVPFELPPAVDTFYVHVVAHNVLTPLFSDGYVSMRVDQMVILFEPNGLVETKNKNAPTVYPNPAGGLLVIDNHFDFASYEVLDLSGRVVLNGLVESNAVDVSTLGNGNFWLRLVKKDGGSAVATFSKTTE